MIHHLIGWIGACVLATCAVPQVIQTWRTKKANDLSKVFLLFWYFGEVLTLAYICYDDIIKGILHLPLYFNYLLNIILVIYLLYAKTKYK